ncbi:hypothetical protein M422DRAFT_32448 [Sphaerobolus stellatus SS14]|uniref:Unplaced genomic scaffold SPHSTscaffold_72, whole genome shotgun sequence n=1 Tax=Sphaerobolus stellatus (strain SS14) TaxID=990650 RepID=A0A0C9VQA7_SPHS4|nr:hypothetical protein M422DRAFT_32448 [Sphaerobolus stellatus SS14]
MARFNPGGVPLDGADSPQPLLSPKPSHFQRSFADYTAHHGNTHAVGRSGGYSHSPAPPSPHMFNPSLPHNHPPYPRGSATGPSSLSNLLHSH